MLRRVGSVEGWQVHLSEQGRFTHAQPPLQVEATLAADGERVVLAIRAGRPDASSDAVRAQGSDRWSVLMGAAVVVRSANGSIELVCFRASDTTPVPKLSAPVLHAIQAVRRKDTTEARTVLSDALEESGALAEAAYVRLEQELQARPPDFVERLPRLRALGAVVGTTFRYLVGRDVEGCVGMRWTFRCPRSWEEMTLTDARLRVVPTTGDAREFRGRRARARPARGLRFPAPSRRRGLGRRDRAGTGDVISAAARAPSAAPRSFLR